MLVGTGVPDGPLRPRQSVNLRRFVGTGVLDGPLRPRRSVNLRRFVGTGVLDGPLYLKQKEIPQCAPDLSEVH